MDAQIAVLSEQRISKAGRPVGGLAKRSFDVAMTLGIMVLIMPLFALFAVSIKLLDPGPLIYRHVRIGFGGKRFNCLKFRTMVVNSQERLNNLLASDDEARQEWERDRKLKNDPRITPLGKLLRRSSIDELPQLFNVLKGEMSLVGPRPVVLEELERYGGHAALYLTARPGLTGLWQTSGRNDVSYESRVALDVQYLCNWSMAVDLLILFKTVFVVLKQRGSR